MAGDQEMVLYPGTTFESWLIGKEYCDSGKCYADKAGTYNVTGADRAISIGSNAAVYMRGLDIQGSESPRLRDTMAVRMKGMADVGMANTSLAVLTSDQMIKYPGGQAFPFSVGCLSLGGNAAVNQSFDVGDGSPLLNASLPPGWLYENKWTPSNSFSLHIGSVEPPVPGSMWFGGYDKNRVIGDIITSSGGPRDGITLWDMGVEVVEGNSPFDYKSKDKLLAAGNSSIVNGLKVIIDGCSPYLTLPKSTCDSITKDLPVNFDDDLGLYLWDTKSDKYHRIVSSPTALTFSFISGSNTDPVTIRVPFMHLNLTLESPLVDTPTPYFPCHVNENGVYVLGRSFLQDAFIGGNWNKKADTWWMAQAPGRSIQATTNVKTIGETDTTIEKGGNDWKASWKGVWDVEAVPGSGSKDDNKPADNKNTPDNDTKTDGNTPGTNNSSDDESSEEASKGGLSTGAIAGIAVGIGLAVIILLIVLFLLFRRRKRAKETQTLEQPQTYKYSGYPQPVYTDGTTHEISSYRPASELPAGAAANNVAPPSQHRWELPSS